MKRFLIPFLIIPLFLSVSSCNENTQNLKSQITASTGKPIINGTPDTSDAHQAVVMLYSSTTSEMCSGTVITPTVVLTAAHCVVDDPTPSSFTVYFGNDQNSFYAQRYVSEVWYHPNYPNSNYAVYNDIAMLRLSSSVPSNVVPIPPLPASKAITTADQGSLQLEFVGFGKTETGTTGTKLKVTQTLQAECDVAASSTCNIGNISPYQIPGGTISYSQNPGGPCSGDSGGPAFIIRNGQEYVAGITSYGDQYCTDYGVSTKVDYFETEIINFTGGTTSENCTNGADDDGDGQIDCDDSDCAYNSACQSNSCDDVITLNCGDSITSSTSSGSSSFSTYNCTSNWTEDGPEEIYYINASTGTNVTIHVTINDSNSDLDLLILQNTCNDQSCVNGSANEGNTAEEVIMDIAGDTYAVVETFDNPGNYTISLTCSGGTAVENCTNGTDDDGDGKVDCADPDCTSNSACQSGSENCTNGTDDDGDGAVDCSDPDCASNSACQSGSYENCTNGIDDDGDGLIDCEDADCSTLSSCTSRQEVCNDGIDNDGDGAADCSDVDCASASNCSGSDHPEICNDGIDNDGDTKIDCNDPDCSTSSNCSAPIENCTDGTDNDGDGKVDCSDADCYSHSACNTNGVELCYDRMDNDSDGKVDCDDPDCISYSKCSQSTTSNTTSEGCSCSIPGKNNNIPSSLPLFMMFLSAFIVLKNRIYGK